MSKSLIFNTGCVQVFVSRPISSTINRGEVNIFGPDAHQKNGAVWPKNENGGQCRVVRLYSSSQVRSYSVTEVDVQLGEGQRPVLQRGGPFFRDIFDGQVEQFEQGVITGESRFSFRHLAQLAVEAFHRVGRVNDPPDGLGTGSSASAAPNCSPSDVLPKNRPHFSFRASSLTRASDSSGAW